MQYPVSQAATRHMPYILQSVLMTDGTLQADVERNKDIGVGPAAIVQVA